MTMPSFGCETDAVDFFLNHPGMYVAPSSQPTEAGNDGNWKDLLKRTAILAHLVESMHDGRAHLDAIYGADPFDACAKSLGRIDKAHREFDAATLPGGTRGRFHFCRRLVNGTCG